MKSARLRSLDQGCERSVWFKMKTACILIFLVASLARAQHPNFLLVQSVTQTDSDADGRANSLLRQTYTYDKRNLVRAVSEMDENGDGITDRRSTITLTYNRPGDRIRVVGETYP